MGVVRWPGRPLDPPLRDLLEAFFGVDLAGVRVHRGRGARLLTRLLGASGVALGRRLFLSREGARRFDGRGASGIGLAAHEVAHVLQYRRHGFLGMLARYLWDYLRGRRAWVGHHAAYRGIGFEREAWDLGEAIAALVREDDEALRAIVEGETLPAPCRERAAEAGRRVRCEPSPAPAPRGW
jgi:hypothetical protein